MSLLWKAEKYSQRTSAWRQESPASVAEVCVGFLLFSHSPVTGHNHGSTDFRNHHQQPTLRTINLLDRFQHIKTLVWWCVQGLLPPPSRFSVVRQVLMVFLVCVLPWLDVSQRAAGLLERCWSVALGTHSNRAMTVWASQRSCFHCPKTTLESKLTQLKPRVL